MRGRTSLLWLADHRGQSLDLLVFFANLLLLGPFSDGLRSRGPAFVANDDAADRRLGTAVLAALVAYMFGALLKRAPLHARVSALPSPGDAGCLFVGWAALHLVLSIVAAASVVVSFDAAPKVARVVAMVVLSTLPTAFAARVVIRPKDLGDIAAWRKTWPMELVADLMIGAAVLLSTFLWNTSVSEFFMTWTGHTFGNRLFGAVLAAGGFAMFYVAPRLLFLIEDHDRWTTWVMIGLTLAPLLGHMLL